METVPWLGKLLLRLPESHPHSWDAVDMLEYEGLVETMPMEQFVKLDNEFYTRECKVTNCDQPAHGAMDDYPDYDPTDYIPLGPPTEWSSETWAEYANLCRIVHSTVAELLNASIAEWVNNGPPPSGNDATNQIRAAKVEEFIDRPTKEWEVTDWGVFHGYLEYRVTSKLVAPSSDDGIMLSAGTTGSKACTCDGPGSAKQKFPSHVWSCPAFNSGVSSTTTSATTSSKNPPKGAPCLDSCMGPGHPNQPTNDLGEVPKMYQIHTTNCPQHAAYDPNKTYGGSYAASCDHGRDAKPFKLLNGLGIKALAYRDCKFIDDEDSDIGVYMYSSWWGYGGGKVKTSPGLKPAWLKKVKTAKVDLFTEQVVIDWPDFSIPPEEIPMVDIVQWMLDQLTAGKRLETACMGGHGRTGTMLALLLCAQGMPPGSAMARVRKHHCTKGIENAKQAEYVAEFYKQFHGNEDWKQVKSQRKLYKQQVGSGHKDKNYGTSSKSKTSGSSSGYVTPPPPTPKFDKELQLWWCDKYLKGYHYDKESKLYYADHKDGEHPVWQEDAKVWTRLTAWPGFKWNNETQCYVSEHKNGAPAKGAGVTATPGKGGVTP